MHKFNSCYKMKIYWTGSKLTYWQVIWKAGFILGNKCSLQKILIKALNWLTNIHIQWFLSVPVCGVWHIDISGRELQDLPGRTYPAVWVRFNLMKVWGQAIVGVLWGRRNVQLQLGCGDVHKHQNGNNGVRMGIMSRKRRINILRWNKWFNSPIFNRFKGFMRPTGD